MRLLCWLFGAVLLADDPQVQPVNVNTRYLVESVEVAGEGDFTLSRGVHDDMQRMVGQALDPGLLEELSKRIRIELHAKAVGHRILRGDLPDHVKVVLEIKRRSVEFDVSLPRFLYHSRQGWTGQVEAAIAYGTGSFTFGILSDNDDLPERNAGVLARYEHRSVGSDRVR
ncbi:MAG: hypothetical protein ACRD96_16740, partial [Bryobacteraceae bacterium]